MNRYLALGVAVFIAILLVVMATVPSTSDFSPYNPLYNGLKAMAEMLNVTPVSSGAVGSLGPGTVVFIIGPSRNFTPAELEAIRSYVMKGGILVVADDFGTGNEVLKWLGVNVRLNGSLLLDPLLMYRSSRLPRAFVQVNNTRLSIYLNYATVLTGRGGRCVGHSSAFSFLDLNLDGLKEKGEPSGPFCIAYLSRMGKGRIIVLSDSSVFINSMLKIGDNVKLLKSLADGRRVYVVSDKWELSTYAKLRLSLMNFVDIALNTSFRYPVALVAGAVSYLIGSKVPRSSGGRRTEIRRIVEEVSRRHPEWDRRELEELAEEVCRGGR